jgi:hypothetical protein
MCCKKYGSSDFTRQMCKVNLCILVSLMSYKSVMTLKPNFTVFIWRNLNVMSEANITLYVSKLMQKGVELQIWTPCFKCQEFLGHLLLQAYTKLRMKYIIKSLVDYISNNEQWQQQRLHWGQWGDDWFIKICMTCRRIWHLIPSWTTVVDTCTLTWCTQIFQSCCFWFCIFYSDVNYCDHESWS